MGVRIVRQFPRVGERADRAAKAAMLEIGALGKSAVREVIRREKRVDRGELINSIQASPVKRTSAGYQVVIEPQAPADDYAVVHEEGRRRGARMPPPRVIAEWFRRKSPDPYAGMKVGGRSRFSQAQKDAHLRSVGFLIARSIARRGIRGIGMFSRGAKEIRKRVPAIWRAAWQREAGR